ncbi:MAG: hypothetical protein JW844_02710 [Candidatus Omnitrophica bacterium]|nr:hypothetical protein [Candidatus Omnitrophota bacterium]
MERAKRIILRSDVFRSCSGVNIVELMLAVVLSSLVFIAVMMIDVSSRRFFKSASAQSRIASDVAFIMEHMQSNLKKGTAINRISAEHLEIWVDELNTPSVFSDDTKYEYQLSGSDLECIRTPDGGGAQTTVLSSDISFLEFNVVPDAHMVNITITGCRKVTGVKIDDAFKYEYLTLISGVCLRCKAGQT